MAMGSGSPFFNSAVNATKVEVQATGGRLRYVHAYHSNASDAFLQVFALPSASVTVGVTTPTFSFLLPKGDGTARGGFEQRFPEGLIMSGGITIAVTTTPTGNSSPASAAVVNISSSF